MKQSLLIIFNLIYLTGYCQYPFKEFPQPVYEEFNDWNLYDWTETKQQSNYTITIDDFFETEALTIQLTSYTGEVEQTSSISIFRGKNQIQKLSEDMFFSTLNIFKPIRITDFNADNLKDMKLLIPYMGNGIAALNVRVIYLIQGKNNKFSKISYDDMMDGNREERDFNKDGIFETITMKLDHYENNNYWTFNIFEFTELGLANANKKNNYPIMTQYLYKNNFKITNKISRSNMKSYALEKPKEYDWKK